MTTSRINCYFDTSGYYIEAGENKVCRRVEKKRDTDDLHHTYVVFGALMSELANKHLGDPLIEVYNDSRFIDDMTGCSPIDQFCTEFATRLRRDILPFVNGTVIFKKASATVVGTMLERAYSSMFIPDSKRDQAMQGVSESFDEKHKSRIKRLKEKWFNGNS